MDDRANRAGVLGEHAHAPRTALDRRAQPGVSRSGGSRASSGDLMRLFVAIAPPPAVLDELDALAGPLRADRPDLRWTSREAWHVTLAFLGQVDGAAVTRLLPRLERAARRHHRFRLAFCGAGAFPSAGRANVLWSGLSGDRGALAHLAESVIAGERNRGYGVLSEAGPQPAAHRDVPRGRSGGRRGPHRLHRLRGQPHLADDRADHEEQGRSAG